MQYQPCCRSILLLFTFSCTFLACRKNDSPTGPNNTPRPDSAVAIFITNAYYNSNSGSPEKVTLTAYNTNGTIKWQIPTVSNYFHPTLIQGNKDVVYCPSAFTSGAFPNYIIRDTFNAIDANTGAYLWRLPTSSIRISNYYVSNDILYCTYYKGNSSYIGALNPKTGATIWEQSLSTAYGASFMTVQNNVMYYIYYGSNTVANASAFDLTTRTTLWRTALTGSYGNISERLRFSGNYIVLANGIQNLQVLDKSSGVMVWSKQGGNYKVPQVGGDYVYAPNSDQGLYCYDLKTGNTIWQWGKRPWYMVSWPYAYDSKVFFTGSDSANFMLSLDGATGTINWRVKTQYYVNDNVAVGKSLYGVMKQIGWYDGYKQRLIRYDIETGAAKDSIIFPGSNVGMPCILTSKGDIVANDQ